MGDRLASIKIEIEYMGIKDKTAMWINYCPESCCNMDQRVIDFFNNVYERGETVYQEILRKQYRAQYRAQYRREIEANERAELKRLKTKYER